MGNTQTGEVVMEQVQLIGRKEVDSSKENLSSVTEEETSPKQALGNTVSNVTFKKGPTAIVENTDEAPTPSDSRVQSKAQTSRVVS